MQGSQHSYLGTMLTHSNQLRTLILYVINEYVGMHNVTHARVLPTVAMATKLASYRGAYTCTCTHMGILATCEMHAWSNESQIRTCNYSIGIIIVTNFHH